MMLAEYIVKFTGDMGNLESVMKKVQGTAKKLEDDEILLKLNYDGNIKSLNQILTEITKQCPEITVQFQYDANKKYLEESLSELKKMEDFKMDIDTNKVNEKIRAMVSDIRVAFESAAEGDDEIKARIRDLYKYINTATSAGVRVGRIFPDLDEVDDYFDNYVKKLAYSTHPITLFDIDTDIDTTINRVRQNIEEARRAMEYSLQNGAVDRGSSGKIEELEKQIKIAYIRIDELEENMKGVSGEAFHEMAIQLDEANFKLKEMNDLIESLKAVRDYNVNTSDIVDQTEKAHAAMTVLWKDFEKFTETHQSIEWPDYFEELKRRVDEGDESLKQLLHDAGLLNKEGSLSLINAGINNHGGIIGEKNVLIARDSYTNSHGNMIEYTKELQQRINLAYESGAKVARILDIIGDKAEKGKHIFEIQETLQGKMLGNTANYGENATFLNPEFLHATNDQLLELVRTIQILHSVGLGTDINGTNLYFSEQPGFMISDLNLKDQTEDISIAAKDFVDTITDLQNFMLRNNMSESNLAEGIKQQFREIVEIIARVPEDVTREIQQSNSPSKVAMELGESWALGYAEGILQHKVDVENAVRQLVKDGILAATEAQKEVGDILSDMIISTPNVENKDTHAESNTVSLTDNDETAKLEKLALLVANVTAAVEEKTQAFHQEDMLVSAAIQSEIDKLSSLLDTLHQVTGIIGEIKLPSGEKLKWTDDLQKLDFDKIQNITSSLQTMYQAISKLNLKDSNLVTSIERILSKSDELKNLAKILSESQKKINEAAKSGDQKKDNTKDKKSTYDKELKMQKEILKLEHEINVAAASESDKYNEIAAKNRPLIEMLNEEIKKNNEKRKQQNLTSQEFRQNINAEIREINRRNEAEVKGIRAAVEERKRQSGQAEVVGNIDGQVKELLTLQKQLGNILNTKDSKLMQPYKNEALQQLDKLQKRIDELQKIKIDIIDGKEINDLSEANEVTRRLVDETSKIKASATDSINKIAKDIKISSLSEDMTDFLTKNTKLSKEFREEIETLRKRLNSGTISSQDLQDIASAFERVKEKAKEAGDVGKSFFDIFKDRLTGVNAQFLTTFFSWQDWIRYGREAFEVIRSLDTALVDLRKTAKMNNDELNAFYFSANDTAKQMGVTTEEIINQSAAWSRLGYNTAETATKMAELSSQFASISPGMDTTTAQEGLVSIMKGFDIDVADAERKVLDSINAVGK